MQDYFHYLLSKHPSRYYKKNSDMGHPKKIEIHVIPRGLHVI